MLPIYTVPTNLGKDTSVKRIALLYLVDRFEKALVDVDAKRGRDSLSLREIRALSGFGFYDLPKPTILRFP
jgi:hypothetical protein